MAKTILKSVVMGAFIGATLFFLPKFLIVMFLVFSIFRMIVKKKMGHRFGDYQMAFANKVRGMSEEEFKVFKTNRNTRNCSNFQKH